METKFSLRPATLDDLVRVTFIEQLVHIAPWNEAHFRAEMDKPYSHFLVLTDDETDSEIVGYLVFWMMFDECQILNIAVDLPYRGMGLAKYMIRKAVQLTYQKSIKKVVLD